MMTFMWWANTQAPKEMRDLGRAMPTGVAKSAFKGKKVV
jgi:FADH2 O2-dependent halogenase